MVNGSELNLGSTEESYPLSPMQQGMLFHTLRARERGVDVSQVLVECPEELDAVTLESAWQKLAERHAILRTSLRWDGLPEPRQEVHREVGIPFALKDWSSLPKAEQGSALESLLREERRIGLELAVAPLMKVILIRKGGGRSQLVWTYH